MKRFIGLTATALLLVACSRNDKNAAAAIQTAVVTRQDIVVDVEATGIIQPINAVEVRSKASGQIIKMPVELGSQVKPGDLLVQIDPRDVQSRFDQATASLRAAEANLEVTKAQKERSDQLAKQGVITAPELESATIAYANAQSQVTSARANLELARIALEDATIRAPITGTVIQKAVSLGQVIASATNSASGGTVLLKMANLSTVVDSVLVSEVDIGRVRPGLTASVRVDAYPNRVFRGVVQKIAPQATVEQSVTMFPVLIRLANEDGALMPGMNSDVSILVEQRTGVLAVPNDAVRSPRDAIAAATALGLDPQKVQEALRGQFGGRRGGNQTRGGRPAAGAAAGTLASADDPPAPSTAQCDSVDALLDKHPEVEEKLQKLREQMRSGAITMAQMREQSRQIYESAKIDPRTAAACRRRGAGAGGATFSMGEEATVAPGTSRPRPGLVFVAQADSFVPRVVTLGVGNYDVTQVLSGLQEGDRVALITAAMLQQARDERLQRIRSRTGLPGMQQRDQSSNGGRRGGGGPGRGGGR